MSNTSSAAAVKLVRKFKDENRPEQSIVTFSGTGANSAGHVEYCSTLGSDYLARLQRLNLLMSDSCDQ